MITGSKPHTGLQTEQAKRIVTFDLEGILKLHTVLLKLLWKRCPFFPPKITNSKKKRSLFRFEDVGCSLMITVALFVAWGT